MHKSEILSGYAASGRKTTPHSWQLRILPKNVTFCRFRIWCEQHESIQLCDGVGGFLGIRDSLTPGEDHLNATAYLSIVDQVYPSMVTVFLLNASSRVMHHVAFIISRCCSGMHKLEVSTKTVV